MRQKISIAISAGDPAGVGPEITAKALKDAGRIKDAVFFVCGDVAVLSGYGLKPSANVFLVDCRCIRNKKFRAGRPTKQTAEASYRYLQAAVELVKRNFARALVTAPISKEHLADAGFPWPGHTEFLGDAFKAGGMEMVFVSDMMKVALVTRHLSLRKALDLLTIDRIVQCGKTVFKLLKEDFKVKKPRIALAGLNPHAGEAGLFGKEEERIIVPAVAKLNKTTGSVFSGPFPADTVFRKTAAGAFDLVMAMYHDQGLIPFKLISFREGVQLTAGLPFIRTSPAHGTAYDIAGKNIADSRSMFEAILLAYRLTGNAPR